MKKILAGILALTMTAGMTSSLFASQTATYKEIVGFFSGKDSEDVYDINNDNKTDIVDVILTKQNVVQQCRQEMNDTAKTVFQAAQKVSSAYRMNNIKIAGTISSDQECEFTDEMKKYNFGEGKWSVDLQDSVVVSARFTGPDTNITGSCPYTGEAYDFADDMNNTENLNTVAETIYNNAKDIAEQYKEKNIKLPAFIITSEDESEFSNEINQLLQNKYGYEGIKWAIRSFSYSITSVVCTLSGENTGAYPVPIDRQIKYNNNLAYCSANQSEFDFDWNMLWSNTTDLNDSAAVLFENAQALALMFKDKQKELNDGIVTSQDDTMFAKYVNYFTASLKPNVASWSLIVQNYKVYGIICTDITGEKTGAFPDPVPQNLDIPFNTENTAFSSDTSYNWNIDFSQCVSTDPERAALPDYPAVSDDQATLNALIALYMINQEIDSIKINNPDFVLADGIYDTDQPESFPVEILEDRLMVRYLTCKKGVRYEYTVKDNKAILIKYYDENASKTISMDIDTMQKMLDESTESIDSPSTGSKVVSTSLTSAVYDNSPETPFELFYNTAKKIEYHNKFNKQYIESFLSENKNVKPYTETSYIVDNIIIVPIDTFD